MDFDECVTNKTKIKERKSTESKFNLYAAILRFHNTSCFFSLN